MESQTRRRPQRYGTGTFRNTPNIINQAPMGDHVGGCALSGAVWASGDDRASWEANRGLVVLGVEHDDAADGVTLNLLDDAVVHDEGIRRRVPLFDLEVFRFCEECKRCGMSD